MRPFELTVPGTVWTPRRRTAFTLIEMLAIIVMMGLLLLIVAPRLSLAARANNVSAAAVDVSARLTMARQSAISRGRDAVLHSVDNKMWVNVDDNGTPTILRDTLFLATRYGVSVTSSIDTVRYNSRGYAKLGASQSFSVSKHGVTQTVCITAGGMVLRRGCTL